MRLLLRNIRLPLGKFSLELDIAIENRVTAVFGPSGAGKTSLLDLIAGLRQPLSAIIQLDGHVLTDTSRGVATPVRHRGIGYVSQDLSLFPHLSVRENLLFGWKPASREPNVSVPRVVDVLEISGLLDRRIPDLSGGEKQRLALARALLASPRLLLLDEPLASLDLRLKARILPYFRRIRDEFEIPMLYVTHDRIEALTIADEVLVIIDGKLAQSGPVQDVFSRPSSLAVAALFTVETVEPGKIVGFENGLVSVAVGQSVLHAAEVNLPPGTRDVFVCIRAEEVILMNGPAQPSSPRNHLFGTVLSVAPEGTLTRLMVDCGFPLGALLTRTACEDLDLKPGGRVTALLKAQSIHLIPR